MKKNKILGTNVVSNSGSRHALNLLRYSNSSDLINPSYLEWDILSADLTKKLIYQKASTAEVKPTNFIYVAKNGLDSNDGSAESPYLTIGKAITVATSGTTVYIYPGTYIENLTLKSGVSLTSPVKFGVYITGNHVASFTGTVVLDNIVLNSITSHTLSVSGSTALNGGVGAIGLPLSSLAIRNSVLRPTPQDGLLEYDGTHLYFTIGSTRKTVTLA